MNPTVKNILAVITGIVIGALVNMGIVMVSGSIIPPPEGADLSTPEGVAAAMPLMQPKHFIFPFLAHALGSFVGALTAALLAANNKMAFAIAIGAFTLLGGIAAAFMIPAPGWFIALDLIVAYIPTAWVAGMIAIKR